MQDLTISLVQTALIWEDVDANINQIAKLISQLKTPTDLIILPEMFTTGFSMKPAHLAEATKGKTFLWMQAIAAQSNATILGSYIVCENNKYYNRLQVVKADGSTYHYDKKHLFAFAGEDREYTAGKKRLIFELKGWNICPLTCYDLRFPAWSRNHHNKSTNREDYDLLLYVANWPKPRINAWDSLLKARSIENQSYVVGVNRIGTDNNGNEYVGHSAVYDYSGNTAGALEEKNDIASFILSSESQSKFRASLPFLKDGDIFNID